MALLEVRCNKCGRILQADPNSAEPLICTHCGNAIPRNEAFPKPRPMPRVVVPGGGVRPPSQPRPAVVAAAAVPAAMAGQAMAAAAAAEPEEELEPSALQVAFSEAFPWAVSVAFHLGAFLLLSFFSTFVPPVDKNKAQKPMDAPLPPPEQRVEAPKVKKAPILALGDAKQVGSIKKTTSETLESYGPGTDKLDFRGFKSAMSGDEKGEATAAQFAGVVGIKVPGPGEGSFGGEGGGEGGSKRLGKTMGTGNSGGNGWKFLGQGAPKDGIMTVVFLVDNSGSMNIGGTFDYIRRELKQSLKILSPRQEFHIIMFADSVKPEDVLKINGQAKLQHATDENRKQAFKWIDNAVAKSEAGVTDPNDAIKLAFKAKPELIFLLTDGEFDQALGGNEGVKNAVNTLNKDKSILVNTLCILDKKTDPIPSVLKDIAKDNGGTCTGIYKGDLGKF